jgi:tRNA-(ms[2]io[6]A)-hydroxylase
MLLACPTPPAWVDAACADLPTLLIDHAHCERKAAATALTLMQRHGERPDLTLALSRLAREELRHYEQVLALLSRHAIALRPLPAGRYARALFAQVRQQGAMHGADAFVVGAFIEARSAERFTALAAALAGGSPLQRAAAALFARLHAAESRHFTSYLDMAAGFGDGALPAERIAALRDVERDLIEAPDDVLRFHSGPPRSRRPREATR